MYITSHQDLQLEGISLAEIHTAIEIKCFNKKFRRSLNVPKSFKDKLLTAAEELTNQGLSHLITETNYCYTLWQENNVTNRQSNQVQINSRISTSLEGNKEGIKRDNNFSEQAWHNFEATNVNQNQFQPKLNAQNFSEIKTSSISDLSNHAKTVVQESGNNDSLKQESNFQDLDNSQQQEQVIKYRGVIVKKTTKIVNLPRVSQKTRTYRGITY